MGIVYPPNCHKCVRASSNLTLKEARGLALIDQNLTFVEDHFEAKYPWIKDPKLLPNNYSVALKRLQTLEKRLSKDPKTCDVYNEQILNMLKRKVARELTDEDANMKGQCTI